MKIARASVERVILPLALAAAILGGWQLYVALSGINEILLPPPSKVASALWSDRSLLASDAWVTIREIVYGYLIAVAFGVALATLIHSSRLIERALYP